MIIPPDVPSTGVCRLKVSSFYGIVQRTRRYEFRWTQSKRSRVVVYILYIQNLRSRSIKYNNNTMQYNALPLQFLDC
ncbi:hypothetical protein QTP88_005753 [Uroleucon formosanum]